MIMSPPSTFPTGTPTQIKSVPSAPTVGRRVFPSGEAAKIVSHRLVLRSTKQTSQFAFFAVGAEVDDAVPAGAGTRKRK